MFRPGRWKHSQPSCTSATVHILCRILAEPKCSAPFTYLQIHAQVLHVVPFRGVVPPGGLSVFQRSNGLAQVAMKRRNSFRETLLAPSNQAPAPVSVRCSTLGKNQIYLASSHPLAQTQTSPVILHQKATPLPLVPSNGKSQGYSFRQNCCQQDSFLRPKLALNTLVAIFYAGNALHKAKFSPNLRLTK